MRDKKNIRGIGDKYYLRLKHQKVSADFFCFTVSHPLPPVLIQRAEQVNKLEIVKFAQRQTHKSHCTHQQKQVIKVCVEEGG